MNEKIKHTIDRVYRHVYNKPYNIIYLASNSIFDTVFKQIEDCNIWVYDDIKNIDMSYSYDLCVCSDPVYYSQNHQIVSYHNIPSLVMFHNKPSQAIKKEDKFLLDRYLSGIKKVFFDKSVSDEWSMKPDYILTYGSPNIEEKHKTKDVLILNPNNNKKINILYQLVKSKFASTDTISYDSTDNINSLLDTISQYRVVVSVGSVYDTWISSLCGCRVITNIDNTHINNTIVLKDFADIGLSILDLLSKTDDTKPKLETESMDKMLSAIRSIFTQEIKSK
jgi:hypothetical protein